MEEKLRDYFQDMVVYKNLKKSNFFSALSLPSFLRDWLLKRFANEDGNFDIDEIGIYIKKVFPRKDEWNSIKDRIKDCEKVKFLAKINIDINLSSGETTFELPDFNLKNKETIIEQYVWDRYKDQLLKGRDVWGVIELGYKPFVSKQEPGKIQLLSFQNFCPYEIDLEYYKDARNQFTIEEWIDVILGAIDYNPHGYENDLQKSTVIQRLLPFIEKRVNLIELAPKGTGKSYLFGNISKNGWLSSGGAISRAKLFYDLQKKTDGLLSLYDFVALDEIQTVSFPDPDEVKAGLKGYLESGKFTVGNIERVGDAGVILLGNIKYENMDTGVDMFNELPKVFHESALIDRFHGFIKGWDIPRMHDDLKINGWALNSEYFSEIIHQLRGDVSYRAIVDELVCVPEKSDTRDTEAVKRLSTGFLKLLFPNVRNTGDVNLIEFQNYCLTPAIKMRETIKKQLGIIDMEYRHKGVPYFRLRTQHGE